MRLSRLSMALARWAGGVGCWALMVGYWYFCPYTTYLRLMEASVVGAMVGHAILFVILTILGIPISYVFFKTGWFLTFNYEEEPR